MDTEFRPLPDDEAGDELFADYVQYAFAPDRGPEVDLDDDRPDPPRIRRGLYPADGDEPLTLCSSYPFETRLRGATLPMGGVSTVATPPEHRRKGYVGEMLRELCREYRDTGTPLSALWPFKHPFYAQFGWATTSRYLAWSCEPSALRSAAATGGTWERVDPDAWADLDAVHRAATEDRPLSLDRSEAWWRERQLRGWDSDPYVYLWRDDDGEPRAYVAYRIEGDWGDRTFEARANHAAADREAFRHLLGFLADHDSQVGTVRFRTAVDCPLHDMVADPAELDCELNPGPMARLVDVPATLDALDYPTDSSLALGLVDPLLDEVTGTYDLAVAGGRATVERTAADPDGADATLGIGPFSQLVVGYRSAADLAVGGELDADDGTVAQLDALFPATTPYLQEGF
ncbi:GNAT family N-acetyltransferase [Halosegnis marinus]|uniref:Enhanced intracellular survival protein Eis n=1 Tax=Halosegnis marinus TaxID=3034023 RepID=A0ABD5ZLA1_9EURY|nr:GNAT family N-acetyltransferase [Halosegnis sp. DT85]